jgi:hypothetical protein
MKTCTSHFFTLLLTVIFLPEAYGQSRISGQVLEREGKALPFANVVLLAAKDSSLVKGTVASETGTFVLDKVTPGRYLLLVSMVGFLPHYTSLQAANEALFLGPVQLKEDHRQLGELVVQANRMLYEQKIDRLVVNVAGSPILVGGTALEVLKRSPGLTIDEARGTVAMNGKNGVLVLINGKPTNASPEVVWSRLRGMSASNIERVELLHSPPSQYDAEGNAGAINIVLRKIRRRD